MPRPRCVLLDAGPVIFLHARGVWAQFCETYEVGYPRSLRTTRPCSTVAMSSLEELRRFGSGMKRRRVGSSSSRPLRLKSPTC